ncbi:uncharacterized protein LOC125502062 [Athalia rosae]|uniref:uncharacterized protein LOC125502062 n=1 Tax=Athalia rosae TaxID=37344 RepID=UPI0020331F77|nr:uncharacterized protein LOC125502062 [Athalia rosae]
MCKYCIAVIQDWTGTGKTLHEHHEIYLKKLFPFYQFQSKHIKFPQVQQQSNGSDCGVFAIAFAISLINGQKPSRKNYDISQMRTHLLKIFESNLMENFPCINKKRNIVSVNTGSSRKRQAPGEDVGGQCVEQSKKRTLSDEIAQIRNKAPSKKKYPSTAKGYKSPVKPHDSNRLGHVSSVVNDQTHDHQEQTLVDERISDLEKRRKQNRKCYHSNNEKLRARQRDRYVLDKEKRLARKKIDICLALIISEL